MDPITEWTIRLGWILVAWLFALGGVVGSFLNVVVYRLPAGKSIVHPGSSCPVCGHPIRWYHNLPVLSWLLLGGRCYDCRTKISARYPLVEFATGMLFVGLFLADARPRIMALAAPGNTSAITGQDVIVRYAGDLWLLATLLCAALIEFDGARPPRRIFWTAVVVGVLTAACDPRAISVQSPQPAWAIAAVGLVAGYAFGLLLEFAMHRAVALRPDRASNTAGRNSAALALACAGAFLGWAAAIAVGLAATGTLIAMRKGAKPKTALARVGFSAWALLFALAWILAARWLAVRIQLMPDM